MMHNLTRRFLFTLPVLLALMLFGASAAFAQTDDSTTADTTTETEYEGIEVDESQEVPSRLGLFWREMRERASQALTFNSTKKAEQAMRFAEERLLIAEKMFAAADTEERREKAAEMLKKASAWMERVQKNQDKALEKDEKDTARLLRNRAKQIERHERIMDRIEENADEELETVLEFRKEFIEKSRRLENALANENIPEDVKAHLLEVKEKIDAQAEAVKDRVEEARRNRIEKQKQLELDKKKARRERSINK